jgi:anthranilate synthase component 1
MITFEHFCKDLHTKNILTMTHTLEPYKGTVVEAYQRLHALDPFALINTFGQTKAPLIALKGNKTLHPTLKEANTYLETFQAEHQKGLCIGLMHFDAFFSQEPKHLPTSRRPVITYHPELFIAFHNHGTDITYQTPDTFNLTDHYQRGISLIQSAIDCLNQAPQENEATPARDVTFKAALSQHSYTSMLDKAKSYIVEGDIFQVVLSNTFTAEACVDSLTLFENLMVANPSEYQLLLKNGDDHLLICSPEMMISQNAQTLTTVPIAGTRAVKKDGRDSERAEALLANQKERSEHLMLVDLARNDLSRAAIPNSVVVNDYCRVKMLPRVMHLVSTVTASTLPSIGPLEGLIQTFPAGTVSGAPKIRAAQIINELEPHRRDYYAGSVFLNNYSHTTESCITIRTIVHQKDSLKVQIGSGIVHGSSVEDESKELKHKGKAIFDAIEATIGGRVYFDIDHR